MAAGPTTLRASFSNLALYTACPLKYRYLRVDGLVEPDVEPDWREAPERGLTVASVVDREVGVLAHRALASWQREVDAGRHPGAAALVGGLEALVAASSLDRVAAGRAVDKLGPGLLGYARGPWPRRPTLAIEGSTHHVLRSERASLDLSLRVDRVVAWGEGAAILDYKTVSPHAAERATDAWQLQAYALALPALLGRPPVRVGLFILDLRRDSQVRVSASRRALGRAGRRLLRATEGILTARFDAEAAPARPCWSCGFRLACPSSLAPTPPPRGTE